MGSYAELRVDDLEVAHFKSEVEGWIALVFTSGDWRSRPATADEVDYRGWDGPADIFELAARVAVVRDRLELTGADWEAVEATFIETLDQKLEHCRDMVARGIAIDLVEKELNYLRAMTLTSWVESLVQAPPDGPSVRRVDVGSRAWLVDFWRDEDVRICLRAVLAARPDDAEVVIDATDLIEGGWLEPGHDPRAEALVQFGWAQIVASPIVVLTEGSTDAQILDRALGVLYPHLRGFIRFPDFTHQPEANVGALVRTVRSFAAAGISNRVVALFDADAAARDAVRQLAVSKLPETIRVMHLPPIDLARLYPTVGPNGMKFDDVYGRACSIELYLGRDVLTDDAGDLRPVRWGAYINAVGDYQGTVEGKHQVLDAFWAKAKRAEASPADADGGDWSGLRAILDAIRSAFAGDRQG